MPVQAGLKLLRGTSRPLIKTQLQSQPLKSLQQQKRGVFHLALPVFIVPAVATFAAVTLWQVAKKRRLEEQAAKDGKTLEIEEKKKPNDDPRLR